MGAINGHFGLLMAATSPPPGTVTWNPADKASAITLSSGNLLATNGATGAAAVRATLGRSTGKFYFEVASLTGSVDISIGLEPAATALTALVGDTAGNFGYYQRDGRKYTGGVLSTFGTLYQGVHTVGVAVDLSAGKVWFSLDGVFQASGNPAAGTSEAFSGLSGTYFPTFSAYSVGEAGTGRFKAADLTYSPPTGFIAWES
jgi:hypothetical protein